MNSRFFESRSGLATALLMTAFLILAASGCATTGAMRDARKAERRQNHDRAIIEYSKVLRLNPEDKEARIGLSRAKHRASLAHFARARRLITRNELDEALIEYQIAFELNPSSGDIELELESTKNKLKAKLAVNRNSLTKLESLIAKARNLPPPGLSLPDDAKLPDSLVFREAGSRDVFTALARFANVNITFDQTFTDIPISIDLRNTAFEDALDSVTKTTGNFYRVTAPRTITIIPDTPSKRREYTDEIVQTFYLSNADLKETIDLLRIVIDARRVAPLEATNAITIKDTPERVAAAARIITAIDKARPEVVIDVELLEVDRRSLREYGLQVASSDQNGISGQLGINREGLSIDNFLSLTQSDVFISNLPSLFYRLLKNDTSTRTLANPHLRTSEGLPAQARFGERVPVPVTTFAPIATGGVAQQPITSFNYENIGVNIDITPRTHHNDDVSLTMQLEISSISGTGFGGLPTFGSRSINTTIRLKDGETSMLAGLIRDDERNVLSGIPGLSSLPLVGRLFAYNKTETQETDIILTLTPHIIRALNLTEADLLPFRFGKESGPVLTGLQTIPARQIQSLPQDQRPETRSETPSTPASKTNPIRPPQK